MSPIIFSPSSLNGHSRKRRTALLTATLTKSHFLNSHRNFVFTHSSKRPAQVNETLFLLPDGVRLRELPLFQEIQFLFS